MNSQYILYSFCYTIKYTKHQMETIMPIRGDKIFIETTILIIINIIFIETIILIRGKKMAMETIMHIHCNTGIRYKKDHHWFWIGL